jgi:nucleotide-binding universal stress UspA family protein
MGKVFNKLGLAVTFSPTGKALLKETKRLQELFSSELLIIHVGTKSIENEAKLNSLIEEAGIKSGGSELVWAKGEPADVILKQSQSAGVDLLIMGALEKETFIKYYLGSIARKVMRESRCSNLIFTEPSEDSKPFKKFYVDTDYSYESARAIKTAFQFALLEGAEEFVIVKDTQLPGVADVILDTGSVQKAENAKNKWLEEESEKLELFVNDLGLKGMKIQLKCVYGKEGWEAGNLARSSNADIYAIAAPTKKLKLIDRVFRHEIEFAFEELPTNLLVIR